MEEDYRAAVSRPAIDHLDLAAVSSRMRPSGTVTSADFVSPSMSSVLTASSTARTPTTPIRIFQPLPMAVVTLAESMEKFVIQGGEPLAGELTVAGNKNAALPILAACLLTEEELLLHRLPRIRDTEAQIALLEGLGVEATWVARQQPEALRVRRLRGRRRRGALGEDPRLVPARRAAAGALRRQKNGLGATGFRVQSNNGLSSSQTVYHSHFHVIPSFGGKAPGTPAPRRKLSDAEYKDIAAKLRAAWPK